MNTLAHTNSWVFGNDYADHPLHWTSEICIPLVILICAQIWDLDLCHLHHSCYFLQRENVERWGHLWCLFQGVQTNFLPLNLSTQAFPEISFQFSWSRKLQNPEGLGEISLMCKSLTTDKFRQENIFGELTLWILKWVSGFGTSLFELPPWPSSIAIAQDLTWKAGFFSPKHFVSAGFFSSCQIKHVCSDLGKGLTSFRQCDMGTQRAGYENINKSPQNLLEAKEGYIQTYINSNPCFSLDSFIPVFTVLIDYCNNLQIGPL